jgi:hypothetical protein
MAEKIELVFGSPGLGKTELLREECLRRGLSVVELTIPDVTERVRAIRDYRLAKAKLDEATKRLSDLDIDRDVIDMQDVLVRDVSDEEIYNLVTDMAVNTTLMEGNDGSR